MNVTLEINLELEAQLRRHKAARSLSDRCRIVLRCADGFSSKEIAAEKERVKHEINAQVLEARKYIKAESETLALSIMEKILDRRLNP